MTTKAAFTPEEWTVVLEGPPTAGMIVITAAHGGMVRETIAMSKAFAEARAQQGDPRRTRRLPALRAGPRRPGRGRAQGTRPGSEPCRDSGDPGDHGGAQP